MVRAVIQDHAPDELFLIDSYSPHARHHGRTAHGPMGLGVEISSVMLVAVVWKIFDEISKELCKEVAKGIIQKCKDLLSRPASQTPPQYDPANLQACIEQRLMTEGIAAERVGPIARSILVAWNDRQGS